MLHRQQANILGLYDVLVRAGFLLFLLFFPLQKTSEQWMVMYIFSLTILWMEVFRNVPSQKEVNWKYFKFLWLKTAVLLFLFKGSMIITEFFSSFEEIYAHILTLSLTLSFWQMGTGVLTALKPSLMYTIGLVVLVKLTSSKDQNAQQVA